MEATFTLDRVLFEKLNGCDAAQLLYVRYVNEIKKSYGNNAEGGVGIHYTDTDGRDLRIEGNYGGQRNSMRIIWRKNGTVHVRSRIEFNAIHQLVTKFNVSVETNENKDDNLYQNTTFNAKSAGDYVGFLVEMTKAAHKVFA